MVFAFDGVHGENIGNITAARGASDLSDPASLRDAGKLPPFAAQLFLTETVPAFVHPDTPEKAAASAHLSRP